MEMGIHSLAVVCNVQSIDIMSAPMYVFTPIPSNPCLPFTLQHVQALKHFVMQVLSHSFSMFKPLQHMLFSFLNHTRLITVPFTCPVTTNSINLPHTLYFPKCIISITSIPSPHILT